MNGRFSVINLRGAALGKEVYSLNEKEVKRIGSAGKPSYALN